MENGNGITKGRKKNEVKKEKRKAIGINTNILSNLIIGLTVFFGISLVFLSKSNIFSSMLSLIICDIGIGLISAALVSYFIDKIWAKVRIEENKEAIQPILDKMNQVSDKIEMYEGRMAAFKQIGLNYCHGNRKESLTRFYSLAKDFIEDNKADEMERNITGEKKKSIIKIVASSARGLVGFFDREVDEEIQYKWRELIDQYGSFFQIMLTHPAYAHLRQPAEERPNGAIEVEIIKSALNFLYISNLTDEQLRFYRGSPTVFMIQVGNEILINPYPYGTMAMKTICLEFTGNEDNSFITDFAKSHFDHTWAFYDQDDKLVDNSPFVGGVNGIEDIIEAIKNCSFLEREKDLRLTLPQIKSIDTFIKKKIIPNMEDGDKKTSLQNMKPLAELLLSEEYTFCDPEHCNTN